MEWQDLGDSVVNGEFLSAADRSPAAAQAGSCLGRNSAGRTLEPGRQQLSVDQQRALVAKDLNCIGMLWPELRAAGREEAFTALGDLAGSLQFGAAHDHCCTGVGWLEVLQKMEGARMQDVSKKLVLELEEMFIFQLKERKLVGDGHAVFNYLSGGWKGDRARLFSEPQWKEM